MKAIVVDDINVKALDGEFEGFFFLHPNSTRRDIAMDFTPYANARKRKDRAFVSKDLQ